LRSSQSMMHHNPWYWSSPNRIARWNACLTMILSM